MASKNSVKVYVENSFYHLYNRGVEKRNIFLDEQDYSVFLSYLQVYLSPKDIIMLQKVIGSDKSSSKQKENALKLLKLKNYSSDLELVCYALLPNHFHLLIKQKSNVINHFMNSLGTRYGMYFNRKYKRIGILFQDVYKAVLITSDEQLLHLSRYINLNPSKLKKLQPAKWAECTYPCTIPEFLGKRHTNWIKTNYILDYFSKNNPCNTYGEFLGANIDESIICSSSIDYDSE